MVSMVEIVGNNHINTPKELIQLLGLETTENLDYLTLISEAAQEWLERTHKLLFFPCEVKFETDQTSVECPFYPLITKSSEESSNIGNKKIRIITYKAGFLNPPITIKLLHLLIVKLIFEQQETDFYKKILELSNIFMKGINICQETI